MEKLACTNETINMVKNYIPEIGIIKNDDKQFLELPENYLLEGVYDEYLSSWLKAPFGATSGILVKNKSTGKNICYMLLNGEGKVAFISK